MPVRSRALLTRAWLTSVLLMILAASASAQERPTTATPGQPPASTQEQPAKSKRPTVGLVLQGGGALGLAHIGVITWLEEHHIPVNYIAGTSMGGLVGGVYATGRNGRRGARGGERNQLGPGHVGPDAFQRPLIPPQEDARDYPNSLEFGVRKGVQFPEGFNSGQQVSLILDQVALPYSEIKSFNDLPIPFACVATDLVTGKPKVFRDGSLSLALRSTMSLPGIFTPVRTKDAIYADGGLLKNIPVNVAKEMGADLTLAIHLDEAPLQSGVESFLVLGARPLDLGHDFGK